MTCRSVRKISHKATVFSGGHIYLCMCLSVCLSDGLFVCCQCGVPYIESESTVLHESNYDRAESSSGLQAFHWAHHTLSGWRVFPAS